MANTSKQLFFLVVLALISLALSNCKPNTEPETTDSTTNVNMDSTISSTTFGVLPNEQFVDLYTLKNSQGMEANITNYGGIVVSLKVPDRNGLMEDVVLGYDSLEQYVANNPYFGALIGRYGNRIGKGTFQLDGNKYKLATNNNSNHLHGGLKGFDKVVWDAKPISVENGVGLRLIYHSLDGEEGYPGNLSVQVDYVLTNGNELRIEYTATTDKRTPVNLTHHSYFNLSGNAKSDILGHELMIAADGFTPVDNTLIPTGEIRQVAGTAFDFRVAKAIGKDIGSSSEQLEFGKGYDHNFVLFEKSRTKTEKEKSGEELQLAATVFEPVSGRFMEVLTTEPGLQFYSGNFLDGTNIGKNGMPYQHRYGFCLETQHFPDSPNKPNFPSTILEPGQMYRTVTVYRFSLKD